MALNSATRKLLLSSSSAISCSKGLSSSCVASSSRIVAIEKRYLADKKESGSVKVLPMTLFLRRSIHHGILFEALQNVQKIRVPGVPRSSDDDPHQQDRHFFNIPDELRRLKSGSLKWLFEVWPGTGRKNSYSALTTIKSALQQEVESEAEVNKVMSKNQKMLRTASEQQLFDVLDYLKMRNIAIRRLIRLPWLLTADPMALEESAKRVKRVLQVKDFKVALSFVNMNELKVQQAAMMWRRERWKEENVVFENRIEWIAHQLSVPCEDVSDMMARHPKLMVVPVENIGQILTLLEGCDVPPEAIVSDPWIFSSNPKTVQTRATILKESGMSQLKPWVFRCAQRKFDKFVEKRLEQRELLGDHKDIRGFLHEKLECPNGSLVTSEMLAKVPALKRATVIKLNEMIEFLFSAGFTARQIRETPRILAHSVETISERLEEVSAYNKPVHNLQLLCRTSKDYRAILRKLKRDAKARSAARKSPPITPINSTNDTVTN